MTKTTHDFSNETVINMIYSKDIMLDEECFKCLVRGGVLHVGKIRIALSDIGYESMLDAIDKGIEPDNQYKDHVKD